MEDCYLVFYLIYSLSYYLIIYLSQLYTDNYTWSEINWSEYGKQFSKPIEFPLPGRIGVILNNNNNNKNSLSGAPTAAAKFESCTCISPTDPHSLDNPSNRKLVVDNLKSLLNDPLPHENQLIKIREATSAYTYLDRLDASGNMEASAENCFELKAHACPISLINGKYSFQIVVLFICINGTQNKT